MKAALNELGMREQAVRQAMPRAYVSFAQTYPVIAESLFDEYFPNKAIRLLAVYTEDTLTPYSAILANSGSINFR